ncbi:HNH endonuclease signature motif containing protein, partial [Blastococcus sp. SYSU D00820]
AAEAVLLTGKLAPTWAELFAGRLTVRKARILLDLLGDADDEVAAGVQARVLPGAEHRPPSRLADRARYHLYRLDADARDRRRRAAERTADVSVQRTADDLGRLVIEGPLPQVLAARDAVDSYARWLRADGDPRPIGRLRSAAALDLLLRPWDTTRPPVTAQVTVHVGISTLRGGSEPGELDGQVVSAAQCREVLAALDMLGLQSPPPGGALTLSLDDAATGQTVAVATRAELARAAGTGRRRTRRGTGSESGEGSGLRRPGGTKGYGPRAAQRRYVEARDRTCRMPGCRRRPGRCDIDHVIAYDAGGPTECQNLCCLCRRHHRIKTHARGWSFTLLPDGRLIVRTPSGVTRTTQPPGWATDPEPDPPWLDDLAPPDPLRM